MGKRSDFDRLDRDFYKTPIQAILPLLAHLEPNTVFIEPCAGDGALIGHLERAGHICVDSGDICPQAPEIPVVDSRIYDWTLNDGEIFITNPPWDRKILHDLIVKLSDQAPTWLLFDADWAHTKQAIPYLPRLRRIVSVGRLIWIPETKMTGKDNCAWYLFGAPSGEAARFYGRV